MPGITTTTTTKELPVAERDTPAVLAYRVGQLETAVKEGFDNVTKELKDLKNNFTPLEDYNKLEKRVVKLESNNGLKQTLLWVGLVASAIINIVMVARLFGVT